MKLEPLPDPQVLSLWKGINFLLNFPDDPNQVSPELAEQLLGLRPRPRLNYLPPHPRPPEGSEWLDLEAWWRVRGRGAPNPAARSVKLSVNVITGSPSRYYRVGEEVPDQEVSDAMCKYAIRDGAHKPSPKASSQHAGKARKRLRR